MTNMDTSTAAPRGLQSDEAAEIEVVRHFLSALEAADADAASEYLHPEIVWHNVSLPKIRGITMVMRVLNGLTRPDLGFAAQIHHIASSGNAVLTERTDSFIWKRLRVDFWVCGTFELEDGKIAVWRDYFSARDMFVGTVKGLLRAF